MESEKYQGFIRGKTLELRPMNIDNVEIHYKWANDRRTRRLMRIDTPIPMDHVRRWVQGDEDKESIHFEVWHIADNKLVGNGGINRINWRNRTASLSLRIGETEYWNQGVGSEASELLVKYGFEELNLHKIEAGIYEPNIGSQKCALNMGMKLEGTMKESVYIDGKYVDANFYSMLDRDWFALHPVNGN